MPAILLNALGVLLGALAGRWSPWAPQADTQRQLRLALTALTVLAGVWVIWSALPSQPWPGMRTLIIAVLSLSAGSLIGHGIGFQRGLSRLLAWAGSGRTSSEPGFAFESVVFAGNPLGIAGAVLQGATGDWRPLALKAALDALAAFGFARAGSNTAALAAVPVFAIQETLAGLAGMLQQRLADPQLTAALATACGLLTLTAAPVVLGIRRVPLANYLPALVLAPLIASVWR
ncbi:MAG: DUF554 domain-containing protein [Verrucomicrobiae bacterium]|nr:DUF554 domain-containing protein [Verrucomicrobiae bacterium]